MKDIKVQVEVRKIRREYESIMIGFDDKVIEERTSTDQAPRAAIGRPRLLSVHQFYYLYCLLSDIRDCAAHSLSFPMAFEERYVVRSPILQFE